MWGEAIEMSGQRFGKLIVVARAGSKYREGRRGRSAKATWFVECGCGATFVTTGAKLREGTVRSCGCLTRDRHRGESLQPR
jgi:hypothetical protein